MSNRAARRASKKQMQHSIKQAMKNRCCGPCTACCFSQAVGEINKPAFESCPHVGQDGCAIYNKRPSGCRAWSCLWRLGLLTNKDRPDSLGIVFDVTLANDRAIIYPGGQALVAREVIPGSFDKSQDLLNHLASDKIIILVKAGDTRREVIGPQDQLEYMEQMIQQLHPVT